MLNSEELRPDEQYMRSLTSDDFGQWMLDHRRYDIDVDTGVVTHLRIGRTLRGGIDTSGYPAVRLAFSKRVGRGIRVHRLIAIKVWSAEAIRDKQIAHLDRVKTHSVLANLAVMTPAQHSVYDDGAARMRSFIVYSERTQCALCGTSGGKIRNGATIPGRTSGKKFGIAGSLCDACYSRLQKRKPCKKQSAVPPCVRCGERSGYIANGRTLPVRINGAKFGIDGPLCWKCYSVFDSRLRRAGRPRRPGGDTDAR